GMIIPSSGNTLEYFIPNIADTIRGMGGRVNGLYYSFNAAKVSEVFMDMVVKHHGIPKTIVSDRDPIFVSKFWKQLFEARRTKLNHSMTYHLHMDGHTKVINHGLKQYLRVMVSDRPQR
nr:Ty3/gypsy retrotransposon protein [Tanacetum cinerariifolium]GFB37644.1 Ty3/gypsy retrotransposon protein [Tanacetum cinerariifolium]